MKMGTFFRINYVFNLSRIKPIRKVIVPLFRMYKRNKFYYVKIECTKWFVVSRLIY